MTSNNKIQGVAERSDEDTKHGRGGRGRRNPSLTVPEADRATDVARRRGSKLKSRPKTAGEVPRAAEGSEVDKVN